MPLRLGTERLVLGPEEPSDASWFTELLNARGTGTFAVVDALKRIDVMARTIEITGIGALVLRKRLDGEELGYTALVVGRCSLEEPELAYELWPRAHGHGYATEAGRALLDAAFDTGRHRIWGTIVYAHDDPYRLFDPQDGDVRFDSQAWDERVRLVRDAFTGAAA